jgi:hypothetical protein
MFFIMWVQSWPIAEPLRLIFVDNDIPEIYLPWQMILYLGFGAATGVTVSLVTRPTDSKKLDRYYGLIRTPVIPGEHVEQPCTIPEGSETLPPRKLIPLRSLEVYVPSWRMIGGFLAGWAGVAVLIVVFLWIVGG